MEEYMEWKLKKDFMYFCPNCANVERTVAAKIVVKARIYEPEYEHYSPRLDKAFAAIHGMTCSECGHEMVQVDTEIANAIAQFNKKGYRTIFSCAGHPGENTAPYIMFGIDPWEFELKDRNAEEAREVFADWSTRVADYFSSYIKKEGLDMLAMRMMPYVDNDPRVRLTMKYDMGLNMEACRIIRRQMRSLSCAVDPVDKVVGLSDINKLIGKYQRDPSEEGVPYITRFKPIEPSEDE